MKRKLIMPLMVSTVVMASIVGCNNNEPSEIESSSEEEILEVVTDMCLSNPQYQVLLPKGYCNSELYAANQIIQYFREATGVKLAIVEDSDSLTFDSNSNYISIGNTSLFNKAVSEGAEIDLSKEALNIDGFYLYTFNNSLLINGYNDRGKIYGALQFIEDSLNVRWLTYDYTHTEKLDSVPLYKYDKAFVPVFEQRGYLNTSVFNKEPEYTIHQRFNTDYCPISENTGGYTKWHKFSNPSHTMWELVPSSKYYTGEIDPENNHPIVQKEYRHLFSHIGSGDEIESFWYGTYLDYCFSSGINDDGTLDESNQNSLIYEVFEAMKKILTEDKTSEYFMIGQADTPHGCTCDKCKANAEKYKSSGTIIRFVNVLSDMLNEWIKTTDTPDREIKLCTFAYLYTVDAPLDDKGELLDPTCMPRDNVYIKYAPLNACRSFPLNDVRQKEEYRTCLSNWSKITDRLMAWTYNTDFANSFFYLDTLSAMKDNLLYLKDCGVKYEFLQGSYYEYGIYKEYLDAYVFSKLCWNINAKVEDLRNEFIRYCFGEDAYQYLVTFQNEYSDYTAYLQSKISLKEDADERNLNSYENFPLQLMNKFCNYFDYAVTATEANENLSATQKNTYVRNIKWASLMIKYMRATYMSHYEGVSVEEGVAVIADWVALAESFGVKRLGEGSEATLANFKKENM